MLSFIILLVLLNQIFVIAKNDAKHDIRESKILKEICELLSDIFRQL